MRFATNNIIRSFIVVGGIFCCFGQSFIYRFVQSDNWSEIRKQNFTKIEASDLHNICITSRRCYVRWHELLSNLFSKLPTDFVASKE